MSNQQIDNFLRLSKLGIGVPVVTYTKSFGWEGTILMYGGVSLQQILDQGMISEASKAVTELPRIY